MTMKIKYRRKNGTFSSRSMIGNKFRKGYKPTNAFTPEHSMEKHASWKGGIWKSRDGNWITYAPKKRKALARWKVEQEIGRELDKSEVVYHINKDKYDDRLENLEIITRAELVQRNKKQI